MKTETVKSMPPPPAAWKVEHPKAFVLGCDPTAFYTDADGKRFPLVFKHVFDLGGPDLRYFSAIRKNLVELELDYETDIYVQNLVVDYQPDETTKNKNWNNEALKSIAQRKKEFDNVDPSGRVPVFLTSERLYKVLMNAGEPLLTAKELYEQEIVMIPADKNKLGRPLIALYRHPRYNYKNQEPYFKRVSEAFSLK
ncbi:hypothetical protein DSECCO2_340130 [anaerobic digester metagenome]